MRALALPLAACPFALLTGCPAPTSDPPPPTRDCNVIAEVCALPFPSSVFLAADETTPTGLSFVLPAAADFGGLGERLAPEVHDGFPMGGAIATFLPEGGDPSTLPADWNAGQRRESTVQLVVAGANEADRGAFHPIRVVLVQSAERGALLVIHPMAPLRPRTRYAVIVTRGLLTAARAEPAPTPSMAALLSREEPDDPSLVDLHTYYRDLVQLAERAVGVPRGDILQLWDFTTRSSEGVTEDLLAMASGAASWVQDEAPPVTLGDIGVFGDRQRVEFHFDVPIWRDDRYAWLHRGSDGLPEPVRTETLRGILLIPPEATPENPAYPLIFGHGLSVDSEDMVPLVGGLDLSRGPYAGVLIDWDLHGTRGTGLSDLLELTGSLNAFGFAGALLQSAADASVLSAMIAQFPEIPERGAVLRAGPQMYLGQSLGSFVGAMATALTPGIVASTLNVGGGGLSDILREGQVLDVLGMRDAIDERIANAPPDDFPVDLGYDALLTAAQLALDFADPLSYASLLLDSPLREAEAALLVQQSLHDGIVPNGQTELLARAFSLAAVRPMPQSVPGLVAVDAPTCGEPSRGMSQFFLTDDGFQAHLALEEPHVQEQALRLFDSMIDADPDNDGNITYMRGDLPGCE
jgi:hypothetical protein